MAGKKTRTAVAVAVFLVAAAGAGMAVALQAVTLAQWWLPVALCLAPAVVAGLLLGSPARWLTGMRSLWLCRAAAAAFSLAVLTGAFYTLNFYMADRASASTCEARITARYTAERRQTRRVGRNHIVGTRTQTVYYLVATLPDGRSKRMEVSAAEYARTSNGAVMPLTVERGRLGIPVIVDRRPAVRSPYRI